MPDCSAFCAGMPLLSAVPRSCSASRLSRSMTMRAAGPSRRDIVRLATMAAAATALTGPGVPWTFAAQKGEPPKKSKKPQFVKEDGILYSDIAVGTGAQPGPGDFVIVDYIAYLSNGTVFDNTSSPGRKPLVFQMGQNKVVPGLETAIAGMRMGGHRLAIIPPRLAYGDRGVCFPDQGCLIPPDSTLEYAGRVFS